MERVLRNSTMHNLRNKEKSVNPNVIARLNIRCVAGAGGREAARAHGASVELRAGAAGHQSTAQEDARQK